MNVILIITISFLEINILRAFAATTFEQCKTPAPENESGWCIPRLQCKIIHESLTVPGLPAKFKEFLMKSKCTDEPEELYCCTLNHIHPAFARNNGLTNPNNANNRIDTPNNSNDGKVNPSGLSELDLHENLKLLPEDCGVIGDKYKISFGMDAGLSEFPFMARLQYNKNAPSFKCGGTLINEKYILTAAHCVISSLFGVRLGEHNADTVADCEIDDDDDMICNDPVQDIPIESKIVHKKFDRFRATNDIALLRLVRPANTIANNVKTICLPTTSTLRDTNQQKGQIVGWGTTENQTTSNILLKATLNVNTERQKCIEKYLKNHSVNVTEGLICAMGKDKVDSCQGDSGGPLLQSVQLKIGEFKKYMQFGIVAAGPPIDCGDLNESGGSLYTNIPRYMRWILDNLKP